MSFIVILNSNKQIYKVNVNKPEDLDTFYVVLENAKKQLGKNPEPPGDQEQEREDSSVHVSLETTNSMPDTSEPDKEPNNLYIFGSASQPAANVQQIRRRQVKGGSAYDNIKEKILALPISELQIKREFRSMVCKEGNRYSEVTFETVYKQLAHQGFIELTRGGFCLISVTGNAKPEPATKVVVQKSKHFSKGKNPGGDIMDNVDLGEDGFVDSGFANIDLDEEEEEVVEEIVPVMDYDTFVEKLAGRAIIRSRNDEWIDYAKFFQDQAHLPDSIRDLLEDKHPFFHLQ